MKKIVGILLLFAIAFGATAYLSYYHGDMISFELSENNSSGD